MKVIPNLLTVFRIIAPLFILCGVLFLAHPYGAWVGLNIFVLAAGTDFLDGFLARRWNVQSDLGRILDPISDKVLVLVTGLILLVAHTVAIGRIDVLLLVPFALILIRELVVAGLREGLAGRITLHASWTAKAKTAVQMLAVGVFFLLPIISHRLGVLTQGMDDIVFQGILARSIEDEIGLLPMVTAINIVQPAVYFLFWLAAILSWVSALGYFRQVKLERQSV